ncbi:hypothetical protein HDU98_003203 [Podochytrium sp. JEL0797]|nr:hypothetical protein HDU98_003203 [Podochytrium sp. JEL0797]
MTFLTANASVTTATTTTPKLRGDDRVFDSEDPEQDDEQQHKLQAALQEALALSTGDGEPLLPAKQTAQAPKKRPLIDLGLKCDDLLSEDVVSELSDTEDIDDSSSLSSLESTTSSILINTFDPTPLPTDDKETQSIKQTIQDANKELEMLQKAFKDSASLLFDLKQQELDFESLLLDHDLHPDLLIELFQSETKHLHNMTRATAKLEIARSSSLKSCLAAVCLANGTFLAHRTRARDALATERVQHRVAIEAEFRAGGVPERRFDSLGVLVDVGSVEDCEEMDSDCEEPEDIVVSKGRKRKEWSDSFVEACCVMTGAGAVAVANGPSRMSPATGNTPKRATAVPAWIKDAVVSRKRVRTRTSRGGYARRSFAVVPMVCEGLDTIEMEDDLSMIRVIEAPDSSVTAKLE